MIHPAVEDLRDRLVLGLARGRGLLLPEEVARVQDALTLEAVDALLLVRLHTRKPQAFRVPDLTVEGVDHLHERVVRLVGEGWLTEDVDPDTQRAWATRAVLAAGCRRAGVPVSGARQALAARLSDLGDWDDAPWVRLVDTALWRRLERFATLEVFPDPGRAVVERLGHVRWVDYPLTPGEQLLPSREAWMAWERLVEDLETLTPEQALAALHWPVWPPGRLDLRRDLVHAVVEVGRGLERRGEPEAAVALYDALDEAGFGGRTVWLRGVRARELAGREQDAWTYLAEVRDRASGAARVALAATGRRLARRTGQVWVPDAPLRPPRTRTLRLDRVPTEHQRPRYGQADGGELVEQAVASMLTDAGCEVMHAEGALWRTILSLLTLDAMFLPVPGMLPVPRLAGPLDHGTPGFAARRAEALWQVVDDIAAGQAAPRVAAAWDAWEGTRIRGVDWRVASREQLVRVVTALGPRGLMTLLRPLIAEGRRAAAGLPDLCVLVREDTVLPGLHPGRLAKGLYLVEVKGEQDAVRDAQHVWMDRLVAGGLAAELWRIVAR